LILMGVWRDSFAANEIEETGVIRRLSRIHGIMAPRAARETLASLTLAG